MRDGQPARESSQVNQPAKRGDRPGGHTPVRPNAPAKDQQSSRDQRSDRGTTTDPKGRPRREHASNQKQVDRTQGQHRQPQHQNGKQPVRPEQRRKESGVQSDRRRAKPPTARREALPPQPPRARQCAGECTLARNSAPASHPAELSAAAGIRPDPQAGHSWLCRPTRSSSSSPSRNSPAASCATPRDGS